MVGSGVVGGGKLRARPKERGEGKNKSKQAKQNNALFFFFFFLFCVDGPSNSSMCRAIHQVVSKTAIRRSGGLFTEDAANSDDLANQKGAR